jgi:hypothetical protein
MQRASGTDQAGSTGDDAQLPPLRATAFGLDLCCDTELSFLRGASASPTGRTLAISVSEDEAELAWPASAELACEEHQPNGEQVYRIESDPEAGYLISGPAYGTYRLSPAGTALHCATGGRPEGAWQRLLIAQALPFATLLQGLEVLHASAVMWGTGAIAFLGPSRSGKTSLALELCRRGASFLADDVVALESREQTLIAHPGTPIAGVDHAEAERRRSLGGAREEFVAVNARERLLPVSGTSDRTPLAALFFLDRRRDGPEHPSFEPTADAQLLLAATFNFVLATPARLSGLLEVCALAARLRVERIRIGPATDASELGAAVEQRLSSPA